jgi:hypothetical protein
MRLSLVALGVALVLVGCSPTKEVAVKGGPLPVDSTPPASGDKTDATPKDDPTPGVGTEVGPDIRPAKGTNASPTQIKPIPDRPGTGGWKASKVSATELASKMDAALGQLSGVQNEVVVVYVLPTGNGRIKLKSEWKSPTEFSVQYPGLYEGHPTLETVRADGRAEATLLSRVPGKNITADQSAWVDRRPLAKPTPISGGDAVSAWPTEMPKLAFARFISGKEVFASLIGALKKDPGMEVTTEERTKNYGNALITDYRIVAQRSDAAAAKDGDLQFEIVIDSQHYVPVTMRTRFGPKGKRVTEIDWAGRWAGGKFPAKHFAIPKSTQTRSA